MDNPTTFDVGDPVHVMCLGGALGASYFLHELVSRHLRRPAPRSGRRAARRRTDPYAVAWVVREPGGTERVFESFPQAASKATSIAVMIGKPIQLDVLMRTSSADTVVLRVISSGYAP